MPVTLAAETPATCRAAIRQYWPQSLWDQAYTTLDAENGTEAPDRVGHNTNGTTDNGCFQVNTVHFGTKGWTSWNQIYDPNFNVQIAYKIYQSAHWSAWYSVCPLNGRNKLPCN